MSSKFDLNMRRNWSVEI